MISGKHFIAGERIESSTTFTSSPATGDSRTFSDGGQEEVNAAAIAAEQAFWSYGWTSAAKRSVFLRNIADEIEARGEAITAIGSQESGLPEARLIGERGRTVGQLRLFAEHIEKADYLDKCHDPAQPDRTPLPRPDLHLTQRPIGPVAVFGASNFPLAFSVAGGDTASALAAGCPVIVKAHPAHPGTSEVVANAIQAAAASSGIHPGVFSLLQGSGSEIGSHLVQHPLINVVGFTGSLRGGRALFDLCAQRQQPIPFFGELGSINPMFLLANATKARGSEIGSGWATSLTMGVGQFCTNPGVAVVIDGPDANAFVAATKQGLHAVPSQTMLTKEISQSYHTAANHLEACSNLGVKKLLGSADDTRMARPYLFEVSGVDWLKNKDLHEEIFGPLGIVVRVADAHEMRELALALSGQLTCTLHINDDDHAEAQRLVCILERKAGRLLANSFPTGVEVCDSMVHGGPYPASTNFGATSVGSLAIRRWLRPVCYQDIPASLIKA